MYAQDLVHLQFQVKDQLRINSQLSTLRHFSKKNPSLTTNHTSIKHLAIYSSKNSFSLNLDNFFKSVQESKPFQNSFYMTYLAKQVIKYQRIQGIQKPYFLTTLNKHLSKTFQV